MQYLSRIARERDADFIANTARASASHQRAYKNSINVTLQIFKGVAAFA
jgi:hypothetical protein